MHLCSAIAGAAAAYVHRCGADESESAWQNTSKENYRLDKARAWHEKACS